MPQKASQGILSLLPQLDDEIKEAAGGAIKKKRIRVTGLSPDAKLERRKSKNREAAQKARDQKKHYVEQLEVHLQKFSERLEKLERNNEELKKENEKLRDENRILIKQQTLLGVNDENLVNNNQQLNNESDACAQIIHDIEQAYYSTYKKDNSNEQEQVDPHSALANESSSSFLARKSAELVKDLQQREPVKKQLLPEFLLIRVITTWLAATLTTCYNQKNCSTNLMSSPDLSLEMKHQLRNKISTLTSQLLHNNQWWGAHQQSWNPTLTTAKRKTL